MAATKTTSGSSGASPRSVYFISATPTSRSPAMKENRDGTKAEKSLKSPSANFGPLVLGEDDLRFLKMYIAKKKISKDKGAEPTEFEESVARALFVLENTNTELKSDMKNLSINTAL